MSEPTSESSSSRPTKSDEQEQDDDGVRTIENMLAKKLHVSENMPKTVKVIEDLTFDGVISHWRSKGFRKVITMVGAGLSTSAGIPDFRTPGTGLYENLQRYKLPYKEAIFDIKFLRKDPVPFYGVVRDMYPGPFKPTVAHYFIRLLHDKEELFRHYSQNIDTLERIAGVPDEKLVEAHGSFHTNTCLECGTKYPMEWMKKKVLKNKIPRCSKCRGLVKPDIVMYGESLPREFEERHAQDLEQCDLLIIMGTSLEVTPFALMIEETNEKCVRLLINREKVGKQKGRGLLYDSPKNTRDVAYIGDCDEAAMKLAEGLGWGDELRQLVATEHARLDEMAKMQEAAKESLENNAPNESDSAPTDQAKINKDKKQKHRKSKRSSSKKTDATEH